MNLSLALDHLRREQIRKFAERARREFPGARVEVLADAVVVHGREPVMREIGSPDVDPVPWVRGAAK